MASGMSNLAAKSAAKVNAKFAEREAQLKKDTTFDWEATSDITISIFLG